MPVHPPEPPAGLFFRFDGLSVGFTLPPTDTVTYTALPQDAEAVDNALSGLPKLPGTGLKIVIGSSHNKPRSLTESRELGMPEAFAEITPSNAMRSPVLSSGATSVAVFNGLISLQTLPMKAHQQVFEDFQQAVDSEDLAFLEDTIRGWQTTANLYARRDLSAALENQASGFGLVHSRLLNLLLDDEEDEEQVKPTGYAFNTALRLLLETDQNIGTLPKAAVTTDEDGGLRIQWHRPDRSVRLIIPAGSGGKHYIYYESDDNYDAEDYDPSTAALSLAQRLKAMIDQ